MAATTRRPEVTAGIGGFAGAFQLSGAETIVAGADGVGSKILLAQALGRDDTVGIDLVAMNVNDILAAGAEPLFFLDYIAIGYLDPDRVAALVAGVAEGCRQAGCSLLGGETAEMPDLYPDGGYDLAGFAVGRQVWHQDTVAVGDRLVAIASTGFHANGYALVRAIVAEAGLSLDQTYPATGGRTLGEALLAPTAIYVKPVMQLWPTGWVRAMAHITGGGLVENVVRTLPAGLGVRIETTAWPCPPLFSWFQELGGLDRREMYRTFNMGVGFTLVVPPGAVTEVIHRLRQEGLAAYDVGQVVNQSGVDIV